MLNKSFFWFLLGCFILVSCTSKVFKTETELLNFLKEAENGYIQHKTVNGVVYSLLYRPTDLLVKQELADSITKEKVKTLREKYSKYMYFNLSMSKNNQELLSTAPKNRNEFGAMVTHSRDICST